MKKKRLALLVAGTLLCSALIGCTKTYATDLMDGVKEGPPMEVQVQEETWAGMQDFSVKLLQTTCDREENTLVSPMSVLSALAMTANGARGETRAQMENILGGSVEQLNGALAGLGQEEDSPLYLANSIWFAEGGRITPNPDFLQVNADCYRAGVFEAPFDQTTVTDINRWVKEHTHGMVEEVLKEIPRDAVMYLINALAFEGEWENPYEDSDVWQQAFTNQAGKVQQVSMMHSEEALYLREEHAAQGGRALSPGRAGPGIYKVLSGGQICLCGAVAGQGNFCFGLCGGLGRPAIEGAAGQPDIRVRGGDHAQI